MALCNNEGKGKNADLITQEQSGGVVGVWSNTVIAFSLSIVLSALQFSGRERIVRGEITGYI